MFTPLFTPRGEHSLLFRRMEGRTENFTPREQNSPLGDNFAPGGQSLPLGAELRMGHCCPTRFVPRYIYNVYDWSYLCFGHFCAECFFGKIVSYQWRERILHMYLGCDVLSFLSSKPLCAYVNKKVLSYLNLLSEFLGLPTLAINSVWLLRILVENFGSDYLPIL
jgi:hypothetical protein